jgi:predicted cupin superfamily sugar epimerase
MTALIVGCQGDSGISGKYWVSPIAKYEINTEEEKAAMEILQSAKIQYEFLNDGQLNATTTIGANSKEGVMQWIVSGDSIFIGTEHYKLETVNAGYVLRGTKFDLLLNKQ